MREGATVRADVEFDARAGVGGGGGGGGGGIPRKGTLF